MDPRLKQEGFAAVDCIKPMIRNLQEQYDPATLFFASLKAFGHCLQKAGYSGEEFDHSFRKLSHRKSGETLNLQKATSQMCSQIDMMVLLEGFDPKAVAWAFLPVASHFVSACGMTSREVSALRDNFILKIREVEPQQVSSAG